MEVAMLSTFQRHHDESSPHHRLERHSVDCGRPNYVGPMTNFHDLEMTSITGEQVSFGELKGNLALVVNVASA
tara:strand:+ start:27037 stop:27255 length:219 start_codon:yes stop_codon:yes gene_type:complete